MTLTTNGKSWLANNAGSAGCFASGGVSFKDGDGVSHTGGTADVLAAFVVAEQTTPNSKIIANTSASEFKAINDGYSPDYANDVMLCSQMAR